MGSRREGRGVEDLRGGKGATRSFLIRAHTRYLDRWADLRFFSAIDSFFVASFLSPRVLRSDPSVKNVIYMANNSRYGTSHRIETLLLLLSFPSPVQGEGEGVAIKSRYVLEGVTREEQKRPSRRINFAK